MALKIENINVKKHYISTTSEQVKAIAQPLNRLGITMFDHFRIYEDNTAIDLTTSPEFCEFYAKNNLYLEACAGDYNQYHDGYYYWDTLIGASPVFNAIEQQCHMGHGVTIVKSYPKHCDHFYLAGDINNPVVKNIFINQKDFLEKFILYYYSEANDLILNAREHSYIFPNGKKECGEMLSSYASSLEELPSSNYTFKHSNISHEKKPILFTQRELQCIYYTAEGYSAKETSAKLNIAIKTVERHLENARYKAGVKNKMALIKVVQKINEKF